MKRIIAIMIAATALTSCSKNDDKATETNLIIQLSHHVSGNALILNNSNYTNAFGNVYTVSRLQYFISDFRLVDTDGNTILIDTAYYVDATNEQSLILKPNTKIPLATYNEVQFVFGLNEAKNTNGAFPNPPENNMEWPIPLGGGYHYMKLEGKVVAGDSQNNFQAHTGPTNGNQNYISLSFDNLMLKAAASEDLVINIEMDINKWWETPHQLNLNEITMVMGNQPVQEQLKANGQQVFNVKQLSNTQ